MKPTGALGTFLYSRGMKELAQMVMDRLENFDGLQERQGLVEEALSCVALSRRGLSELEIIGMIQVGFSRVVCLHTRRRLWVLRDSMRETLSSCACYVLSSERPAMCVLQAHT